MSKFILLINSSGYKNDHISKIIISVFKYVMYYPGLTSQPLNYVALMII